MKLLSVYSLTGNYFLWGLSPPKSHVKTEKMLRNVPNPNPSEKAWPQSIRHLPVLIFCIFLYYAVGWFRCNCLVCQRIFLSSSHQWGEVCREEKEKEEDLLLFFTSLLHVHILDKIIFLPSTRCFPKHFYAWASNLTNIGRNCIHDILSFSLFLEIYQ